MPRLLVFVLALVSALAVGVDLAAGATGPNAGFESGLCQWSTLNSGSGQWFGTGASSLPISGAPAPPPAYGSAEAAFDQGDPSSGVLYQNFKVPIADPTLDFVYAYANYWSDFAMAGDPYDLGSVNQWLSIDVLHPGADPRSLDPGDIITTVVRPSPGDPLSTPGWVPVSVDLSAYAGQTVRVRFVVVDTQFFFSGFMDADAPAAGCGSSEVRPPERVSYCSVPGNTWPDGTPIPEGTFLDLQRGQPDWDPHYKGAGVANFVEGLGLTCDQIPIGFTHQGFAGNAQNMPQDTYPYYGPPSAPVTNSMLSFSTRFALHPARFSRAHF